jgi:hypothetical protein
MTASISKVPFNIPLILLNGLCNATLWLKMGMGGQEGVWVAKYCTDKKVNQNFPIYKEIQKGAVAKSYITNGLLIYREIFPHFLIYWEAFPHI